MLDTARVDTSLEAKRRDLTAKIVEGRKVIAALMERHTSMGLKIDQATDALREMERHLTATVTVIELFDRESLVLSAEPLGRTAPPVCMPAPPSTMSYPPLQPESFRPVAFFRCLSDGHDMVASRSMPGRVTCRRCKIRRRV